MKLLELSEPSLRAAFEIGESGMDFAIVTAWINVIERTATLVVRSNGSAALIERQQDVYTLVDMYDGQPLPQQRQQIELSNVKAAVLTTVATLPAGYLPARGAHPLLGSITLTHNTRFFRFTSSLSDSRFSSNTLIANTYLTPVNDRQFVNSGFGAVGRYALPLPLPASYLHDYTIPKGETLLVGTVAPQFGQAGGGVEVKTVSDISGIVANVPAQIDDY